MRRNYQLVICTSKRKQNIYSFKNCTFLVRYCQKLRRINNNQNLAEGYLLCDKETLFCAAVVL